MVTAQKKLTGNHNVNITQPYDKNSNVQRYIQYQPMIALDPQKITIQRTSEEQQQNAIKLHNEIRELKEMLELTIKEKNQKTTSPLLSARKADDSLLKSYQQQVSSMQKQNNTQQQMIEQLQRQVEQLTLQNQELSQQVTQLQSQTMTSFNKPAQNQAPQIDESTKQSPQPQPTINGPGSVVDAQLSTLNDKDLVIQPKQVSIEQLNNLYSAFGSCISKQVRNMVADRPTELIYNYFFQVAHQVYDYTRQLQYDFKNLSLDILIDFAQRVVPNIEVDPSFMPAFQINDRFKYIFETIFGTNSLEQKIQYKNLSIQNPTVLFVIISGICCSYECKAIKYDKLTGTLEEFQDIYGAQTGGIQSDMNNQVYVLLPQWYSFGVVIPAYVRMTSVQPK